MNLYNINATSNFLKELASFVIDRFSGDPTNLAQVRIYVPTRRACRHLQEEFYSVSAQTMFLPRIAPIEEIDEIELLAFELAAGKEVTPFPSPYTAFGKKLYLTYKLHEISKLQDLSLDISTCRMLASEFSDFLDIIYRNEISVDKIQELLVQELAIHGQIYAKLFVSLLEVWLCDVNEKYIDKQLYINQVNLRLSEFHQSSNPGFPIIIAGSTGSCSTTRKLIKSVLNLENGYVFLHGFNAQGNPPKETHPQFYLHELVKYLQIMPTTIAPQDGERLRFLSSCFADSWSENITQNFHHHIFENDNLESLALALKIRDLKIAAPEESILVTTNNDYLRHSLNCYLAKFNLVADDSIGVPLAQTSAAIFVSKIIEFLLSNCGIGEFLALAKHGFFAPIELNETRQMIRQIELKILRRPNAQIENLHSLVKILAQKEMPQALEFCQNLITQIKKISLNRASLLQHSRQIIELATAFSANLNQPFTASLEGQSYNDFINELQAASEFFGEVSFAEFYILYKSLIAGKNYATQYGHSDKLVIMPAKEARCLYFDHVFIAGVNDGYFPQKQDGQMWFSQYLLEKFGMDVIARSKSQAAHDCYLLAGKPNVYISCAKKIGSDPVLPSSFYLRLAKTDSDELAKYEHYAKHYYEFAQPRKLTPPQPKPPLAARPKQLSVTAIQKLKENPYFIYGKEVLRLRKLPQINEPLEEADFGNFIHKTLELAALNRADLVLDKLIPQILELGLLALQQLGLAENIYAKMLWWPRFERIVECFVVDHGADLLDANKQILVEITGQILLPNLGFTLVGKADRIDSDAIIYDYKTGALPSKVAINQGHQVQLLLEALMMEEGGFINADKAHKICYLRLSANGTELVEVEGEELQQLVAKTKAWLHELISYYQDPEHGYLANNQLDQFNDYEHLARTREFV